MNILLDLYDATSADEAKARIATFLAACDSQMECMLGQCRRNMVAAGLSAVEMHSNEAQSRRAWEIRRAELEALAINDIARRFGSADAGIQ